MSKNRFIAIVLAIIALALIYLGITGGILPPTLTGVGFLLIASVLMT